MVIVRDILMLVVGLGLGTNPGVSFRSANACREVERVQAGEEGR